MRTDELLTSLKTLLREALRLRYEGVAYAKLAHAQAMADGYMRALEDSGAVSREALLKLVIDERRAYLDETVAAPKSLVAA